MIASRWKKVWADFWGNKSRTFLTIMTIMVGTFAVGFTANMKLYTLETMDADYQTTSPSEGEVYAYPLNDDMVRLAREVPGVEAVEGVASARAQVIRPGEEPIDVLFLAVDDPEALTVNTLKPAEGETSLPPLSEREVLIDSSAKSLGYKPGDTIMIELPNEKRRELKVAGYIHSLNVPPFSMSRQVGAYVKPETLEWLGGPRYYGALSISVSEKQTDVKHVTEVSQAVADRVERAGATVYFVNVYQPGHYPAWDIMQGVFFLLGTLGYMTVLLGAFLVINTVTALMTQQTRQIGIMKSVGGQTGQVSVMYVILILAFGACALGIAVPLANKATEIVGAGMAQYINILPMPFHSYPNVIVQQAIVALLVPLLAALFPIWNSVRITVREAISDYGLGGNAAPKDKRVNRTSVLIPRPIRLSLRNVFRRKFRLALTLFTLVLGGAIFIGVYNLQESFNQAIEDIQGYILADINVNFGRYYRYDEVAEIAQAVPGVSSVEGWTEVEGTYLTSEEDPGTQIMFVAPPSNSTLIEPIIIAGRWLRPGDENAVVVGNHFLIKFPNTKVGDWLTVDIYGKETKWRVVGVYTIVGNVSPPLLYVNYEYISRLIGRPEQVYSLRILTDRHDEAFQKRVSEQIQTLYEERGIQFYNVGLGAEFVTQQKSQTDILIYMMLVMATLIAVVGGLGLAGTMSINVLERTREIGVMRAVGASNGNIQSIVIVEGMVVGLLSWAISIFFSLPITNILCYGVGVSLLTTPMNAVYGMTGVVMWLVVTIIIATVASALPARRASRLTVKDTLAYE